MAAYRAQKIRLWGVPPKSPDLNPIEMLWGWLRKKLRLMDLAESIALQAASEKIGTQQGSNSSG